MLPGLKIKILAERAASSFINRIVLDFCFQIGLEKLMFWVE